METSLGEIIGSTIITLLIAMPIIVDEVSEKIRNMRK